MEALRIFAKLLPPNTLHTALSNSVAARLTEKGFMEALEHFAEFLPPNTLHTALSDTVATRLLEPGFADFCHQWFKVAGKAVLGAEGKFICRLWHDEASRDEFYDYCQRHGWRNLRKLPKFKDLIASKLKRRQVSQGVSRPTKRVRRSSHTVSM